MSVAPGMPPRASTPTAPAKMTLRRFVRVTLDNFRQLIQTIAAPTTELPVPKLTTPQHAEPPPAMETDTFGSDTLGTDSVGDSTLGEGTAGQEELALEVQPASPAQLTLPAALESLLFVSDAAVEPSQLARALGLAPAEVEQGLQVLDAAYREGGRGLRLQTRNGRYQLVTAPEAANLIETFLNLDTSAKLSAPALETLAVVAYRQPVTRAQIEAVRGVDCSGVLRSLLQRGLLEEVGRLDAPGRPVLYGVTDLFMHHFGLTALHELPPLENVELARIEEALEQQP